MAFNSRNQLALELFQAPDPTLESFVEGENREALEVLKSVRSGSGPQFTYLFGQKGVGCTHLLRALGLTATDIPVFCDEQSLYLVDDIDSRNTDELQAFFDLVNEVRAHPGTHIVVAGHHSPRELQFYGVRDDVTSRLSWGTVLEIQPLSDAEKQKEFIRRAQLAGLNVTPEALAWIENYLPRDMHTMICILEGIISYSLKTNRTMTIPLIKEWLERERK